MQDDLKLTETPGSTPAPTAAKTTPGQEVVDEQKLEAEFGPPVNADSDTPTPTKMEKVKKLIPKVKAPHGHRREFVLLIVAIVVLIAAAVASFIILQKQPKILTGTFIINQKPYIPPTVPSTLTGLQVKAAVNDRPVTAVMIENSPDARPQSGLDQAGVVFEALAEGGVTRFMALYQDTQPDYLGPVRSARPYYIQWLLGFDAAYAHVGGSADALSDIRTWHVKDMNQFYNADYYQRISSRYAPHNVYTSITQLNRLEAAKGYGKSNYTGFPRKKDAAAAKPNAATINVTMSGYYYDSMFKYNAKTNNYTRYQMGAVHTELLKSGRLVPITPKVVITMIIPEHAGALDATGAYYADYAAIGSGKVMIFQDGTIATGTWTKTARTAQITFTDKTGAPIKLNAGQTWIIAVPNNVSNVTYR